MIAVMKKSIMTKQIMAVATIIILLGRSQKPRGQCTLIAAGLTMTVTTICLKKSLDAPKGK